MSIQFDPERDSRDGEPDPPLPDTHTGRSDTWPTLLIVGIVLAVLVVLLGIFLIVAFFDFASGLRLWG